MEHGGWDAEVAERAEDAEGARRNCGVRVRHGGWNAEVAEIAEDAERARLWRVRVLSDLW